jgi:hypothetical protein
MTYSISEALRACVFFSRHPNPHACEFLAESPSYFSEQYSIMCIVIDYKMYTIPTVWNSDSVEFLIFFYLDRDNFIISISHGFMHVNKLLLL